MPAVSTAKVHRSLKIEEIEPGKKPLSFDDYRITLEDIPNGPVPEIYDMR